MALKEAGWHISQTLIWLKNSMIFSFGQDYHRIYEPVMFGWKDGKKHYSNHQLSSLKEVFSLDLDDFSELMDVWYQQRDNTQEYIHPTQKPVRLAERALKKNSQPNDIVIDLFGGSGSTLMACEQLKRKARLMEMDPKYVDAIIMRWERWTGEKAKLLSN